MRQILRANPKPKKDILKKVSGDYMYAEKILGRYSQGRLTARQTQKELAKKGLKADLRGIKGAEAFVYPIDGEGGFEVEF
tara:strand:- start:1727 stop:1966 length:240 start_codon:yes stop_codon:yes gene_type:complete